MYEGAVQDLIDELGRLPGVGPKSAQRLAFHLLAADADDVTRLVTALTEVKRRVRFCEVCGNVAQEPQCRICRDPRRDLSVLRSRQPAGGETLALLDGVVVMECTSTGGPVDLAMDPSAVTGFLAWLEAQPPGATLPRR